MSVSKIILLPSRYTNIKTELNVTGSNYGLIFSNSNYIRVGRKGDSDNIDFVDFEGGLMVKVEDTLVKKRIKSIKPCYYIEFE